ncbi:MAG: SOS response-associated peptidase [Anaerolineae bacterium]|nr:SOS response-associated peptidase [Phycisphaerae bacterium]
MCGRYTLIRLADFIDIFPWIHPPDESPPERFNIAPTQSIAVVSNNGKDKVEYFHWGLIPSWAKSASIGNRMINARAETLAEKPAFRTALKRRRCLIPVDGFYEWRKLADGKTKQPMYIRMRSKHPFAFAGLWETWHDPTGAGGEIPSCTIITTTPNTLMNSIHDRMPAIVRPEDYRRWLAPGERPAEELAPLLAPFPPEEMEAFPVSKLVNSPANESAKCIDEQLESESPLPAPEKPTRKKTSAPESGGLFG